MLQCVVQCCSMLQSVAVCCSILQSVAVGGGTDCVLSIFFSVFLQLRADRAQHVL